MSSDQDQVDLDYLRVEVEVIEHRLLESVRSKCPGEHKVVQHRDRQPPWCPHCGRTERGERIQHVDP